MGPTRPPSSHSSASSALAESGRKNRKDMTIEEREAAYREARERIFGSSAADTEADAVSSTNNSLQADGSKTMGAATASIARTSPITAPAEAPQIRTPHSKRGDAERVQGGFRDYRTDGPTPPEIRDSNSCGGAHAPLINASFIPQAVPLGPLPAQSWPIHPHSLQQYQPGMVGPSGGIHGGGSLQGYPRPSPQFQHPYHPHYQFQTGHISAIQQTNGPAQTPSMMNWQYHQRFGPYNQQPNPASWSLHGAPSWSPVPTAGPSNSVYNYDAFSPFPRTPSNLSSSGTGSVGFPSPAPSVISSVSSLATKEVERGPACTQTETAHADSSCTQHLPHHGQIYPQAPSPVNSYVAGSYTGHPSLQTTGPLRLPVYPQELPARSASSSPMSSISMSQRSDTGVSGQGRSRSRRGLASSAIDGSCGRLNLGVRTLFDPNGHSGSITSSSSPSSSPAVGSRHRPLPDEQRVRKDCFVTHASAGNAAGESRTSTLTQPRDSHCPAHGPGHPFLADNSGTAVHAGDPPTSASSWPRPYVANTQHHQASLSPYAIHAVAAGPHGFLSPGAGVSDANVYPHQSHPMTPVNHHNMLGSTIRIGAVIPVSAGEPSIALTGAVPGTTQSFGSRRNPLATSNSLVSTPGQHAVGSGPSTVKSIVAANLPPKPEWLTSQRHTEFNAPIFANDALADGAATSSDLSAHVVALNEEETLQGQYGIEGYGDTASQHHHPGVSTPRTSHSLQHAMAMTSSGPDLQTTPSTPQFASGGAEAPPLSRRRFSLDSASGGGAASSNNSLRGDGLSVRRHHLRRRFSTDSASAASDDGSYSSLGPSASASNVGDFQDEDEEEDDDVQHGAASTFGLEQRSREVRDYEADLASAMPSSDGARRDGV